jgi:glucose uptake protein GlcU
MSLITSNALIVAALLSVIALVGTIVILAAMRRGGGRTRLVGATFSAFVGAIAAFAVLALVLPQFRVASLIGALLHLTLAAILAVCLRRASRG